ncbi:unnamed protein product, partial [Sphenostylis stenocarpa]
GSLASTSVVSGGDCLPLLSGLCCWLDFKKYYYPYYDSSKFLFGFAWPLREELNRFPSLDLSHHADQKINNVSYNAGEREREVRSCVNADTRITSRQNWNHRGGQDATNRPLVLFRLS